MTKVCTKCNIEKNISLFYRNKLCKLGVLSSCKECNRIYVLAHKDIYLKRSKEQYKNNKLHLNTLNKINYNINKEKRRKQIKQWNKANKEKIKQTHNSYIKNKRQNDINFKLASNLRSRINKTIKGNFKSGSSVRDLGCTVEFLKQHLESKFKSGMNWNNYNFYGWHIDHIIPLSAFDLTNREQFLKATHYTNLQPLWSKDNLSKGKKI